MMPSQRVRIAESRIRNKLSNGPLRAQSNAAPDSSSERGRAEYSATWGHTSVAGDMLVSRKVRGRHGREARWHRERYTPVLDDICQGRAFLYPVPEKEVFTCTIPP